MSDSLGPDSSRKRYASFEGGHEFEVVEWSVCSVAQCADLHGPPFWLPPETARSLPTQHRPGLSPVSSCSPIWVPRAAAEEAALAVHGSEVLEARKKKVEASFVQLGQHAPSVQGGVILLHGTGGSGLTMYSVAAELGLPDALMARRLSLCCPSAPFRSLGLWADEWLRVWFDRRRIRERVAQDTEKDINAICKWISDVVARTSGPVFVVGFSTGAAMALHAAARVENLAGCAAFAGWLPKGCPSYARLRRKGVPPVLFAHGSEDVVVPIDWMARCGAQVGKELAAVGETMKYEIQQGHGHEFSAASCEAMLNWIDRVLAARSATHQPNRQ